MRHKTAAVVVTAVLCASALLSAAPEASIAASCNPQASWTKTISGTNLESGAPQPYSSPAVGDLFGDGRNEVVAAFKNGQVYAWYSDGTQVSGWPKSVGAAIDASPTLSDLNNDGKLEVVVAARDGTINVWDANGVSFPGWPQHSFHGRPKEDFDPGFFSSVAVGDLLGDGRKELVAGSFDRYLYVWNSDGSVFPNFPILLFDSIWDTPILVDLDHNGQLDIVEGSDSIGGPTLPYPSGGVYWAFRPNGTQLPGWPKPVDQVAWASPAAGDLDRNGVIDVVAGSGHFFSEPRGMQVNAWNEGGSVLPGWPQPTGARNFGSPAVGDLLGDSRREVVEASEDGKIYAWAPNGSALAGWPVSPGQGSLLSSAVIAPVDGGSTNGVWIAAGRFLQGYRNNGSLAQSICFGGVSGYTVAAPAIADLGGGQLSAVTVAEVDDSNSWKLYVLPISGTSALLSGSWPTFHGNVQRNGTNLAPVPPTGARGPDVSSWASGRLDVFVRGTDARLYHRSFTGAWSGWEGLGGVLTSDPTAVSWSNGRIDVFVRGSDNQLWHKWYENGWYWWEPLGGALASAPDVSSWAPGRLDIFVRGTDNQLWHRWYDNGWYGWEPLGGVLTSDPTAVSWSNGRIDIFVRGSDNQLWHRWYDHGWYGWEPLGGILTSGPDASKRSAGVLDVFVRGTDGGLYRKSYSGGWSSWGGLGSPGGVAPELALASDPAAVSWNSSRIDVFSRATDNALWHRWWDGVSWQNWERLGLY
jgi:hypothetical protein